ncbi:NAD(P)-binding protein [Thozetella sp. PMI_491]|nr:NAD(P)-binding protein [Thozetella sp. PMI_491]
MSTLTRKVVISSFGTKDDVSNVQVVEESIPAPAKHEVQVEVLYAGFSGADISMRMGRYPMQRSAPLTPGYTLVGRVRENGSKCNKFKSGDVVAAVTKYNAESQLANIDESLLLAVPSALSGSDELLQQVCALCLDWSTAYGMVERAAKVQAGQKVFIHGLSGAVGYGLLTLCKLKGAQIYGTASPRNHGALADLGAAAVFDYKNKDWIESMQGLGGADVVFDPLGFESWDESWSILSPAGLLVGYGGNSPVLNEHQKLRAPYPSILKLLTRGWMPFEDRRTTFYYIDPSGSWYEPDFAALVAMLEEGKIFVPIKAVWPLTTESIQEAHKSWGKLAGMGSLLVQAGKAA